MNDYLTLAAIMLFWVITLAAAFSFGRVRGYDAAQDDFYWARWIIRRHQNRSRKF
jgi:hypothetical protein